MCCPTTATDTTSTSTTTSGNIATPIDVAKRTRRVSFTTDNDIVEVERVDAALIQYLFYSAADYRRFREERRSSLSVAAPAAPASPVLVVTKPKKHGDDAGYMQRRQRLQRLVAKRDDKITATATTNKAPRPSSSLRRAPRRGPAQQLALQNMRSRMAAASA